MENIKAFKVGEKVLIEAIVKSRKFDETDPNQAAILYEVKNLETGTVIGNYRGEDIKEVEDGSNS